MESTEQSMSQLFFSRVVYILIALNVLLFMADTRISGLMNALALYYPLNDNFAASQFVTHMFMHGNLTHLLFNMFALWMFGSALENVLGKTRFLIFYFVCGIGAALIYTVINNYQFNEVYSLLTDSGLITADIKAMLDQSSYPPSVLNEEQARTMLTLYHAPMLGASGAIYGILVAYATYFPNNKIMLLFIPYPIAAKYFVPAIIGLDLFSGVTGLSLFGGGVAHFAHVGGAVIGFLLLTIWRKEFTKGTLK